MPSSLAGFGQDDSGVNVQNKRALMRSAGESINPNAWKTNTVEELVQADKFKIMSSTTRKQAKDLQDMSSMQMARDNDLVNEALTSKLHKTDQMAGLLGRTIDDVDREMSNLEYNRKRLLSLVKQTEQKIMINDQRLQVRSQRPARELVNDDVQAQLQSSSTLLKSTMDKLHRCLRSTEVDMGRLQESRMLLNADLQNKHNAMQVDNEVITGNTTSGMNSRGGMRKSTVHPHSWQKSTEELVKTANQWRNDSQRLRGAVENLCQDARFNERTMRQSLHVAAMGKLADTQQLQEVLMQQHAETCTELEEAQSSKYSIEEQLQELDAQIAKTKGQYVHRTQRPDAEKVVDEAETALLKTLTNQKAMRSSLLDRKDILASKIAALEAAISKLDANIRDKDMCIKVDSKALMADGREEVARPPSRASLAFSMANSYTPAGKRSSGSGAGGSGRSSMRDSIMSRISHLEADLRKTRQANETLENNIKQYTMST